MKKLPIIGITMGDPAGIGPEIVVQSLNEKGIREFCIPVVIGSSGPLEEVMGVLGIKIPLEKIREGEKISLSEEKIPFIDIPLSHNYRDTKLSAQNGAVSLEYIHKAVDMLNKEHLQGLTTAPTNKEAMHKAGLNCAGVTELLAGLANIPEYSTVQIQGGVYIFQMTTHVPLRKALEKITEDNIYDFVKYVHRILLNLGIKIPKIGISGINPHAGEGGVLGDEEQTVFAPAIKRLREGQIAISDPQPVDTLFIQGLRGRYDALVYLFHDTANTAIKTAAKEFPPVVVTAGLPYIRTTVAHGTAYDIAYKGIADWKQFREAIITAAMLVEI
ncbi:MAG: 4-hydroxythreonine-4-phosphate dehydrogenase PdxA [Treponema sp.]|jgi:4-hydroxythreonine-4-phosphate dehydrogenase|nr:4-hydroxythreonine-4-phosphate dehydrogenase PdxA [Treponema sp.]